MAKSRRNFTICEGCSKSVLRLEEDRCLDCRTAPCKHEISIVVGSYERSNAFCVEGCGRVLCWHPKADNCGRFWAQRALVEYV